MISRCVSRKVFTAYDGALTVPFLYFKVLNTQYSILYTTSFNSNASLLFWWPSFFRQIRIEGVVEKLSADESDTYFNQRPLSSRVSACVSNQSKPLRSKQELLDSHRQCMQQYQRDFEINRPEDWGGYIVTPNLFEFWQAAPNRLHDRFRYTRNDRDWGIVRLAP